MVASCYCIDASRNGYFMKKNAQFGRLLSYLARMTLLLRKMMVLKSPLQNGEAYPESAAEHLSHSLTQLHSVIARVVDSP